MIRECHNRTLQTNQQHCEEEPQNIYIYKKSVRQYKQSNHLSLPLKMIAKLKRAQSNSYQNKKTNTNPSQTMGSALNNMSTTTEPPP